MVNLTPPEETARLLFQNRVLTEEIRRRVDQLAAINSVAAMVSQSLNLDETLSHALDSVLHIIPVKAAGISLINDDEGELVLRAARGWKHDFVTEPMRMKLGEGLSGYVIEHDELVVTGDVSNDPRIAVPAFMNEPVQAMALAPMHARGRIIGIVSVMHYEPYTFSEEQTGVLQAVADQLGVALDNAKLFEDTRTKQNRLSAVINSTADAIIATDKRGIVNLVNPAAEGMFEIKAKNLLGKPLRDAMAHPVLRGELQRALTNAPDDNSAFEITLESGRYLSVTLSPVEAKEPLEKTERGGWVLVIQDITHLRDSEKNRVRFIQTAAHDLRNPLGVVLSALDMLSDTYHNQPASQEKEILELANASVQQMQMLIDDLLDLERVQSGADVMLKPIEMLDLIQRVVLEAMPPMQHKQQTFTQDISPSLPSVMGDSRWLSRAMVNLLSNANKYTQEGGQITLRAHFDEDAREVVVEVQDNGPGIAASNQKRIFDNFYREPHIQASSIKGTGLGLSIVKSVVEQHGGRVYVQSMEGQGSTFGIRLPAT
ncbi:MAG: GAF domain-containing protein [Anaerolineae bacterium]|nr:GAF domain-containing protein [Anaerolineae bacterium]